MIIIENMYPLTQINETELNENWFFLSQFNEKKTKYGYSLRYTRKGFGLHVSVTLKGGHRMFDCPIGKSKNIAKVLSDIHDPLCQRKW